MKKILLLSSSIFLLTACGTPTVEDLIEDPQLLAEVTMECQTLMAQGKDTNIEKCQNAQKAALKMSKNMMKGLFGG